MAHTHLFVSFTQLAFKDENVDVLELTQSVSIYQMFLGFIFAPLCVIPGVQRQKGMHISEIISSLVVGCRSFGSLNLGTVLLCLYVVLNFCSNFLGLVLTKRTSAGELVCWY